MKKIFSSGLLVLLASVIFVSGCKGTKALLPNVSGKACEIMVVIDKDYWEGPLGDEVRLVLADEVPYLPQREPLFNLSNVPLSGFSDLFRVHRNIMLLQVDPQIDSVGIFFHKDVWASPQSVVQVSSYTSDEAIELIKDNAPLIVSYFEQAERDRVIGNALLYEDHSVADTVSAIFGGSLHFPKGYKLRMATDDFAWIAYEHGLLRPLGHGQDDGREHHRPPQRSHEGERPRHVRELLHDHQPGARAPRGTRQVQEP